MSDELSAIFEAITFLSFAAVSVRIHHIAIVVRLLVILDNLDICNGHDEYSVITIRFTGVQKR